ncbi:formate dehydrogenase accessory sulfurtransferase FdhD [Thalassotalea atypica]|uniref:formate dehydrogenase accessory sulfurtransferase FdhD n=1 Tax=Thalassotalea atypica TaxID=2054316 RepID=UPI002574257E|nr:formate dehydrogenase accessory sulfurtransferase FdhD [Thalassotalea atypica]
MIYSKHEHQHITKGSDDDTFECASLALDNVNRKVFIASASGPTTVQSPSPDTVIVEAPLQILLSWFNAESQNYKSRPLIVTMRTPGNDKALVSGLLLSLGVITAIPDVAEMQHLEPHVFEVTLSKNISPDWPQLERQSMSFSSCGVCGQQQVKQLAIRQPVVSDQSERWLSLTTVFELPKLLSDDQAHFAQTGGVHGAGLWQNGNYLSIQEDVGRHNAVDKVIGEQFILSKQTVLTQLAQSVLVLSGRVSFELVQKAIMANIPVIVAIGAPSSLAITLAKRFNITLIGFAKENRCNVYSGDFRLV